MRTISSSDASQMALTGTQGYYPSLWFLLSLLAMYKQTSWDLKRGEGSREGNMVGKPLTVSALAIHSLFSFDFPHELVKQELLLHF